jgi:aspartate aminotransferase-like enzyme
MKASFLTGPVDVRPEVRAAFCAPPDSHRSSTFLDMMQKTRASLGSLVNSSHVTLMVGSGTLANDAVAAQIRSIAGSGLILSNGEFGERLVDHASRWDLRFTVEHRAWGRPFDWRQVRERAQGVRPAWIWAVLAETSTGVLNPLPELLALSRHLGAELCVDAVSAIGLLPVNLDGVRFATAVSGKGLAAYPGLAAVFHDGRLAASKAVPRYLDLAAYEAAEGVPFTHSSNLLSALASALSLADWPRKLELVRRHSRALRGALRSLGLPPLAREEDAAPGIITIPLRDAVRADVVARALSAQGIEIAWQSRYLQERNWLQIALMGEIGDAALRRLPAALGEQLPRANQRPAARWPMARRDHNRSTAARR